jgi:uncharacterized metal-binding protein
MSDQCACEASLKSVLVFACSGGSNVGQMANAAAVELARQGQAKMYCLAGLGGRVGGMIDASQHVDYCIVIDGCPVACARKIMEQTDVPVDRYVVVTALGIKKSYQYDWPSAELARVVAAAVEGGPLVVASQQDGLECGCGCT